jgi:hypothetical protein
VNLLPLGHERDFGQVVCKHCGLGIAAWGLNESCPARSVSGATAQKPATPDPLEGIEPLTDDDRMPFGVFIGLPMKEVPGSYLDWAEGMDWLPFRHPRVAAYIRDNRKAIDLELKEKEDACS